MLRGNRLLLTAAFCLAALPSLRAQSNCVCSGYNSARARDGYSFVDGEFFQRARLNLADPKNFGATGVVLRPVVVAAGTSTATDSTLSSVEVFFTGWTRTDTYTPAEKSVIKNAVLNGMNLVITADDAEHSLADLFDVALGGQAGDMNVPSVPDHPIFAGPFGRIQQYRSGAPYSAFRGWDDKTQVLATSSIGPTMLIIPRRALGPLSGAVLLLGDTDHLSTYSRELAPNDSEPSIPVTDALVLNIVSFLCNPSAPASAPHLVFPQIANGQGTISAINITSSDSSTQNLITASFSLRDDAGAPYPVNIVGQGSAATFSQTLHGNQSLALFTDGVGTLKSGTAIVQASPLLGGNIIFFTPGLGATSVSASPMAGGFVLPVVPQPGPTPSPGSGVTVDVYTGVAISNLSGKTATVRLELWDANALVSDSRRFITLPARGHMAKFLHEQGLYPGFDFKGFRGTLRVVSRDGLISVTALQLGSSTGQFTAVPATPVYR